ncbi:LOW QUALITY PROTEIN: hypothetical protein HZS_6157, partial [Henneguya salminicola]
TFSDRLKLLTNDIRARMIESYNRGNIYYKIYSLPIEQLYIMMLNASFWQEKLRKRPEKHTCKKS